MDDALTELVWQRAHGRCEYCHLPSQFTSTPFEIDHIIAQQHEGKTHTRNLALTCFACNHHKGPNLSGVDPRNGKKQWLFNPRRHKWTTHFRWDGPVLFGRTSIGRTTIAVLAVNLPFRIAQRFALMEEGRFHESRG
jgi:hypothetical protein